MNNDKRFWKLVDSIYYRCGCDYMPDGYDWCDVEDDIETAIDKSMKRCKNVDFTFEEMYNALYDKFMKDHENDN